MCPPLRWTIIIGLILSARQPVYASYFDTLSSLMTTLPPKQQIIAICNIPFNLMNQNLALSEQWYKKAAHLAGKMEDDSLLAVCFERLNVVTYYEGEYDKSIRYAHKAIQLYEKKGHTNLAGNVYALLGYQLKRRNLSRAFQYMQKGLHLLSLAHDTMRLYPAYNNYGVLYEMTKQSDSAIYYYSLSRSLAERYHDSISVSYSLYNLAYVHFLLSNLPEAEKFLNECLAIREKQQALNGLFEAYLLKGDLRAALHHYDSALFYYQKALIIAQNIDYLYGEYSVLEKLSEVTEKMQKFQESLQYKKLSAIIKDKLLNATKDKNIAELEIKFETQQKEKELIAMRLKVEQKNKNLVIVISVTLLLFLIAWFMIRQQRARIKQLKYESQLKDQLFEEQMKVKLQEQKLRISSELHDNIGSHLTAITMSLEQYANESKQYSQTLSGKISFLQEYTRNAIQELRDTIWAMREQNIDLGDFIWKVKALTERFSNTGNTQITIIHHLVHNQTLDGYIALQLLRIIQEALHNALKYANASLIKIVIKDDNDHFLIQVKDNGKGFSPEQIKKGYGLSIMKKRAEECNARFIIESSQQGTKVSVMLNTKKQNIQEQNL